MLQDVLLILPQSLSPAGVAACAAGALAGLILWLAGATWSRWVVTLLAVAAGGFAGTMLPRWYLWPVNSMSLAVLGAVVLGVLAFVGQRASAGLVLGLVLVAWASLGTWAGMRGAETIQPRQDWEVAHLTAPQHAQDVWQRLPRPVAKVLPYSAATAMISGLCVTLLWPRVGRVLMGSALGITTLLLCALSLLQTQRPAWLVHVPAELPVQTGILAGAAVLGALVQWQLLPAKKEAPPTDHERQQPRQPLGRYGEARAC